MEYTHSDRWTTRILAFALAAVGGLALATPVNAQEGATQAAGSRYQVLLSPLTVQGPGDKNFGKKVANALAKHIDRSERHTSVDGDQLKDALKRFRLKEENLADCTIARQLAVQMGVELVMCGTYENQTVSAQFIGARTGETFSVPPFSATKPEEAAKQIYDSFLRYTNQLQYTAFCLEYLASQQWQSALDNCNRALEISDRSVTALTGKARAQLELGQVQESLATLQKALELNPVHQDALRLAGIAAARAEQQELSRQYFRQYLELNPGDAAVRLNIAADQMKAGDPEGALQIAEEGLSADSNSVELLTFAGHFALNAAQRRDAQNRAANQNAGDQRSAEATALYEKALGYYQKVYAIRGSETDAAVLNNIMVTLTALDRNQEAVEFGAQAVRTKPESADLWLRYATALEAVGRLDEGLAALDSAVARDSTARVHMIRGQWFAKRDQFAQAREAFNQSIQRQELGENTAEALANEVFRLGYSRMREGRTDSALGLFALTRDLATDPKTKGMASFWSGYTLYQRGVEVHKPQTAASARASLPMFRQALDHLEASREYAESVPSIRTNLMQLIDAVKKYIEYEEALIKRG